MSAPPDACPAPSAEPGRTAPADEEQAIVAGPADERRRAALRQLGKAAAYGAPITLSLMSIRRAAADS